MTALAWKIHAQTLKLYKKAWPFLGNSQLEVGNRVLHSLWRFRQMVCFAGIKRATVSKVAANVRDSQNGFRSKGRMLRVVYRAIRRILRQHFIT